MIASTLHHHLPSLFVTEAVVGLRESTLLNTITVKMSVFWGLSTLCLCNVICSKCDIVLYILRHETFYFRYLYVNIIQVSIAKGLLGSVFVPACANFDIYCVLTCLHDVKTKKHFPYNMFLLFRLWRHLSTTSQLY